MANPTEDQNMAISKAAASGAGKKSDALAFKPTRTHGTPLPPVQYMADPLPGPKVQPAGLAFTKQLVEWRVRL